MTFYSQDPLRFGSVSMVTASLGPNDPEVGSVVREGDEEYIFVYNNGNSQISVGQGGIVSGVTGYSVTVSSVANTGDIPIGVVKHATLTTGTYGWLQKKGFGFAKIAANSAAALGALLTVGDDGVWGTKTTGTGYAANGFGKVISTATGGTITSGGLVDAYWSIY